MITRLGPTPSRALYGVRHLATASSSKASSSTSTPTPKPPLSKPSPPTSSSVPTHHFITLLRSTIGLQEKYKGTVRALGLRRRHSVTLQPFSKDIAGMILRIKELISVRNVTLEEGEDLVRRRRNRSEGAGVQETGLAFGGGRKTDESALKR